MSEVLYIRLNSHADAPIWWLIWSNVEREIIASGELLSAEQLSTLSDKADHRKVVVIVPSQDVTLKSVNVPGKSSRAHKAVVPYMLEDELTEDVDELFFAYSNTKIADEDNNCFIAVVKRQLFRDWLQCLQAANIKCQLMIPEILAMPLEADGWSVAQVDEQIIVRQGQWRGMTLDTSLWTFACEQWLMEDGTPSIASYTTLPNTPEGLVVEQKPQEMLLTLIAQSGQSQFNLLQGEFSVKDDRSPIVKTWAMAAGICLVALLLSLGQKGAALFQLKAQQAQIEQQIIDTYIGAFPETKRVRVSTIRSQLKRKMSGIGSGVNEQSFLMLLSKLGNAYTQVPTFTTTSIKFDSKRGEIRLTASARDYQAFDKFKGELEKMNLLVTQGAQNNQGDLVTGSLSIKERS
ncbi:type II secretion system protein GspL [Thalassotalea atypica]|uniref:type II secretion system protein GspL n=1 Tax=Thalassotalea atypica TaxID=2054316 RepID=UPI0025741C52|nr:type II secretion system protein GspL [Thalassotalea atypica]